MLWLSALVIAAISNLDNLAVGFAFGMGDRAIAAGPNVIIAAVTMMATAGAMTSGRALSHLMSPGFASTLGSLIIVAIGGATIVASIRAARLPTSVPGRSHRRDGEANRTMSWREAFVIGVALSLNNLVSGVGAGVAGVSPLTTTALAGAFSLICVGGGSRVGSSFGRLIAGGRAQLVGGLLLLGVGAATLVGAR